MSLLQTKRLPLAEAERLAQRVRAELAPWCSSAAKTARVIASEEEADIFKALGLDFIPPERREK